MINYCSISNEKTVRPTVSQYKTNLTGLKTNSNQLAKEYKVKRLFWLPGLTFPLAKKFKTVNSCC